VNMPYFHVFVGFGFSVLQFGHLAMVVTIYWFMTLNIYICIARLRLYCGLYVRNQG
jgi:hypothetical protein